MHCNKTPFSILVIDRPTRKKEDVVKDIFNVYGEKYNLMIFLPKEDDPQCRIQMVFYDEKLIPGLEAMFGINIRYGGDDCDFFDHDLTEIEPDTFYYMLNEIFNVEVIKLTQIENKTTS